MYRVIVWVTRYQKQHDFYLLNWRYHSDAANYSQLQDFQKISIEGLCDRLIEMWVLEVTWTGDVIDQLFLEGPKFFFFQCHRTIEKLGKTALLYVVICSVLGTKYVPDFFLSKFFSYFFFFLFFSFKIFRRSLIGGFVIDRFNVITRSHCI